MGNIEKWEVETGDTAGSEDLDDTLLSSVLENECLVRNGSSQWVNQKLGLASMADLAQSQLVGRGSGGSGAAQSISIDDSLVMNSTTLERAALTGDVTAPQGSNTTTIAAAAVDYAMIQNVSAARLLGRNEGSTGPPEEIAAGTGLVIATNGSTVLDWDAPLGDLNNVGVGSEQDLQVIAYNAGTWQNTFVITGMITDANVTLAKIANAAANDKLLGSGDAGSGNPYEEITLGTNLSMSGTTLNATGGGATDLDSLTDVTITTPATNSVLIKSAGDWIDGLIVTDSITDANVTLAKMADMATDSLIGRGTAATGVPEIISLDASLTMTATTLAVTNPSSAGLSGYVANISGVVVADHTDRVVNGNARGANAVDLQTDRASADDVAAAAHSVISGGEDNEIAATSLHSSIGGGASNSLQGTGEYNTIAGGGANVISDENSSTVAGGIGNQISLGVSTIGGGANNICLQRHGTIPGGNNAETRRHGELAYGGASAAEAQKVVNVATALTTDATPTTLGYTNALADWTSPSIDTATIPFPVAGAYIVTFNGTLVGQRAEGAADTSIAVLVQGAMKKSTAGTVAFVGTPFIELLGRDDAALDVDIALAAANGGADIKVTGKASETYVWTFEWQGAEILVPDLS